MKITTVGLVVLTVVAFLSPTRASLDTSTVAASVVSLTMDSDQVVQIAGETVETSEVRSTLDEKSATTNVYLLVNIGGTVSAGAAFDVQRQVRASNIAGVNFVAPQCDELSQMDFHSPTAGDR